MSASSFIHIDQSTPTTLSEITRIYNWVQPVDFLGLYAYATQSGATAFDLALGPEFWASPSRWLFGLDYGRTQPQAVKFMCEKAGTEVRLFDGAWIVEQTGFVPRQDFHLKSSLLFGPAAKRYGLVVGSGNFSSNGLRRSIEAGAAIQADGDAALHTLMSQHVISAQSLWDSATPAEKVIDLYESRWRPPVADDAVEVFAPLESADLFWIEVGYVTRNRGPNRPGNQIDFPRGMSKYFGFSPPSGLSPNSVIGSLTFAPPMGGLVTNNLRLGNNMMEKVSLPVPESHGFDAYDGKILVFERAGAVFNLRALEEEDFQRAFRERLLDVRAMASGRRYGRIA